MSPEKHRIAHALRAGHLSCLRALAQAILVAAIFLHQSSSNRATPIGQSGRPPKNMPIERCSEGANRAQPIEPIVPRATVEFGKRLRFSAEGGQPWWHFKLPPWDFLLAYPASRHPSIREAAFGRLSTKGCGLRPPPPLWIPLCMGVLEAG